MRFKIAVSKIRMIIGENDILPYTHGIAYWRESAMEAVCYPIPFNLIVGWSRAAWIWMRQPHWRSEIEKAYLKGRQDGNDQRQKMFKFDIESARYQGLKKGLDPEIRRAVSKITDEIIQQLRKT